MRNIPGLSRDIFNRADQLVAKARDAREAVPGAVPPSATIAPARVINGVATLRLYDYIDPDGGYWGISANEFADALDNAGDVTQIVLRINSGGGAVWDGLAILNTLRSHTASVTAVVDGVAASAASFIAVACDEVVMMPNSKMMIHDAMGLCIGQAVDMREYASFLDQTSGNIAEIYAERSGGTVDEWRALMTQNGLRGQWYSAQEAVDAGLADSVGGQDDNADEPPADKAPQAQPTAKGEADQDIAQPTAAADQQAAERRRRFEASRHAMNAHRVGVSA